MNKRTIIFYILGFFVFSLAMLVLVIEEDQWLKDRLQTAIQEKILQMTGRPFVCTLTRLRLITGTIELSNVSADAGNGQAENGADWTFTVDQLVIRVSLI